MASDLCRALTTPGIDLGRRRTGQPIRTVLPGWAEDWYVEEAVAHGVDAVVHLVADVSGDVVRHVRP